LVKTPDVALLHFIKGLALVRRQQPDDALTALREANRLDPDNPRFAYVLAVSLEEHGEADAARLLLESTLKQHPEYREVRLALIGQYRDHGILPRMNELIEGLRAINPGDPLLGPINLD
jgi:predicted Zn-dependent protease